MLSRAPGRKRAKALNLQENAAVVQEVTSQLSVGFDNDSERAMVGVALRCERCARL
jgi:hypothetical protein